jgi:hypothetical protein
MWIEHPELNLPEWLRMTGPEVVRHEHQQHGGTVGEWPPGADDGDDLSCRKAVAGVSASAYWATASRCCGRQTDQPAWASGGRH